MAKKVTMLEKVEVGVDSTTPQLQKAVIATTPVATTLVTMTPVATPLAQEEEEVEEVDDIAFDREVDIIHQNIIMQGMGNLASLLKILSTQSDEPVTFFCHYDEDTREVLADVCSATLLDENDTIIGEGIDQNIIESFGIESEYNPEVGTIVFDILMNGAYVHNFTLDLNVSVELLLRLKMV